MSAATDDNAASTAGATEGVGSPGHQRPASSPALLTPADVAARLGVAPKTLQRWRAEERGPRFVKLSSKVVRYRSADVDAFVEGRSAA